MEAKETNKKEDSNDLETFEEKEKKFMRRIPLYCGVILLAVYTGMSTINYKETYIFFFFFLFVWIALLVGYFIGWGIGQASNKIQRNKNNWKRIGIGGCMLFYVVSLVILNLLLIAYPTLDDLFMLLCTVFGVVFGGIFGGVLRGMLKGVFGGVLRGIFGGVLGIVYVGLANFLRMVLSGKYSVYSFQDIGIFIEGFVFALMLFLWVMGASLMIGVVLVLIRKRALSYTGFIGHKYGAISIKLRISIGASIGAMVAAAEIGLFVVMFFMYL